MGSPSHYATILNHQSDIETKNHIEEKFLYREKNISEPSGYFYHLEWRVSILISVAGAASGPF